MFYPWAYLKILAKKNESQQTNFKCVSTLKSFQLGSFGNSVHILHSDAIPELLMETLQLPSKSSSGRIATSVTCIDSINDHTDLKKYKQTEYR